MKHSLKGMAAKFQRKSPPVRAYDVYCSEALSTVDCIRTRTELGKTWTAMGAAERAPYIEKAKVMQCEASGNSTAAPLPAMVRGKNAERREGQSRSLQISRDIVEHETFGGGLQLCSFECGLKHDLT